MLSSQRRYVAPKDVAVVGPGSTSVNANRLVSGCPLPALAGSPTWLRTACRPSAPRSVPGSPSTPSWGRPTSWRWGGDQFGAGVHFGRWIGQPETGWGVEVSNSRRNPL